MGIFDKIGDIIGDVVDGVVDFVDDVFNVDLKKVLSNDIVKYGLMAVSIFTGGVAIANGVMTGFSAGSAAQGFMNTFVAGAKGFVEGVATGLANPMDTFGDLTGLGGTAAPGTGQLSAEIAGAPSDASKIVDSLAGDTDIVSMGTGGQGLNASGEALLNTPTDLSLSGMAANDQAIASAQGALDGTATSPAGSAAANAGPEITMPDFSSAAKSAAETATDVAQNATADKSIWSRIADGAKDFATSPGGMQTLAGMASGWAEGKMIQEQWDEKQRVRRQREDSWTNGQSAPRAFNGSLPTLQALRDQVNQRGNQANAKYGY